MRTARPAPRLLAASLLVALACVAPRADARPELGALLLAQPRAAAELTDVATGYAAWLEDKLARSGLPLVIAAPDQDAGAANAEAIARLRELASANGAGMLLIPELRLAQGSLEVRLVLEAVADQTVLAAPRASAPLAEPGPACISH